MRKLTVSMPDSIADHIEAIALQQGRTVSDLAAFLLESGYYEYLSKGVWTVEQPENKEGGEE